MENKAGKVTEGQEQEIFCQLNKSLVCTKPTAGFCIHGNVQSKRCEYHKLMQCCNFSKLRLINLIEIVADTIYS